MPVHFVELDTGSKLVVTCKNNDDGTVINLTGSTAKVRFSIDGAATVERSMTVTDAAAGIAEYTFASGELDVATSGKSAVTMEAETEITDGGAKIITQLVPFFFRVRKRLP